MSGIRSLSQRILEGVVEARSSLEKALERGWKLVEFLDASTDTLSQSDICREGGRLSLVISCSGDTKHGGPLLAYKDVYHVNGEPAGFGTGFKLLHGPGTPRVLSALLEAGFRPAFRSSMDVMGLSTSGFNPLLGHTLNPLNPKFTTGGSSGGSAGLAAMSPRVLGLGSDAGGSARIPAAYTGVVGFKPSSRLVDHSGMFRLMPSFETIGLLSLSFKLLLEGVSAAVSRSSVENGVLVAGLTMEGFINPTVALPEDLGVFCRHALDQDACRDFEAVAGEVGSSGLVRVVRIRVSPVLLKLERARAAASLWEAYYNTSKICGVECIESMPDGLKSLLRLGYTIGLEGYNAALKTVHEARSSIGRLLSGTPLLTPTVSTRGCIPVSYVERLAYTWRALLFTGIANTLDLNTISIPTPWGRLDCGAPLPLMLSGGSVEQLLGTALAILAHAHHH